MTRSDEQSGVGNERTRAIADALRTRYWSWTLLSTGEATHTLLQLLLKHLPHISPESWESRFAFGGIYVNGIEALQDRPLPIPCKVEYYEPKFEIASAHDIFPAFRDDYILYRDEHILVAYKPPGLSSMPAKEQRHFSLKASIERLVQTPIHMPSRLDVSAQGVVLISISRAAHAPLQRAFEMRAVTKTYLCASHRCPEWRERTVTATIGRDATHPVLRTTQTSTGQAATTIFRLLGAHRDCAQESFVLSASPVTGRTHQIRVHAAHEGLPLLGDRFYGGAPHSYLHLVSYSISCLHPITREPFICSLPEPLQPEWVKRHSAPIPNEV
jgi:23S rRNA-/tRNA-specific pseudouridylate synthase